MVHDTNHCLLNKPPHLFPLSLLEIYSSHLVSYSISDVDVEKPTIWLETYSYRALGNGSSSQRCLCMQSL